MGFADENPAKGPGIKQERIEKTPIPYLTRNDQRRLVEACSAELRSVIVVAIGSGLRRGELARLEWSDVHGRRLDVRKTKSKQPREVHVSAEAATRYLTRGYGGRPATPNHVVREARPSAPDELPVHAPVGTGAGIAELHEVALLVLEVLEGVGA